MISCYLQGGLGNYMFQIAATESLVKKNNDKAVFDFKNYSQIHKPLETYKDNILRKVNVGEVFYDKEYNEPFFEYNEIPYHSDMLLKGYFQSEKYFDEKVVRELFSIDNNSKNYINDKYGDLLKKKTTSIHIRRGDFLDRLDRHPVQSMDYFNKAIEHFDDNIFLIFSDDINWCKENFKGNNFVFIEGEKDYIDLYLMSMCKNNIISNSSFSWWGAWLNENDEKIIISPSVWFGDSKNLDTKDIYCDNWIVI